MFKKVSIAVASLAVAGSAFASGADLTAMTGALTASDVTTPIIAIGGTLAAIAVATMAVRKVLAMLKRG
jgi:hypothetical protein